MAKPYATVINQRDHIKVLTDIVSERLDALHQIVGENRIYLVDEVNSSALYFLAEQFDVLGYKGWNLAPTEADKRKLIKRAIELHRFKGTAWSLREAVKSIGFSDVVVIENAGLLQNFRNGEHIRNGSIYHNPGGDGEWATFSIIIDLENWTEFINTSMQTLLMETIDEYKNARSHLIDLIFRINASDSMLMIDATDQNNDINSTDSLAFSFVHNGMALRNGEYGRDLTGDNFSIEIN